MWNTNNAGLPVSPTELNGQFWVASGLPYQPPQQLIPNVQLSQNMAPLAPLVAGYLVLELQNNAQKNPLRVFLYNLTSQNGYQTQKYQQMFLGIAEYAEYIATTQSGRISPEQAIQKAAQEICAIMTAVALQEFPNLAQAINLDQQGLMEAQKLLQHYNAVTQELDRFYNPQPQGFQNYRGAPQQGNVASFGTMGNNGGFQQNRGYQPVRQGNPVASQASGMWADNTPPSRRWDDYKPTSKDAGGSLKPRSAARKGVVEDIMLGEQPQNNHVVNRAYRSQVQPEPVQPAPQAKPQPQGPEIRPAATSGWKVDFKQDQPINIVFDPTQFVLMHKRDEQGRVTEYLERKKPGMDYNDHELDPKFKPKAEPLAENGEIVPHWDMVASMADVPADVSVDVSDEAALKDLPTPRVVEELIIAHSAAEAEVKAQATLLGKDILLSDLDVYEFAYNRAMPFLLEDNLIGAFKSLESSTSLLAVRSHLNALQDRVPEALFTEIDRRLTRGVNEALLCNMQIEDFTIDSFMEDLGDLLEVIEQTSKYGDAIASKLDKSASQLVKRCLKVLSGDALTHYLQELGVTLPDGEDKPSFLVLAELNHVTHVPWTAAAMKLEFAGIAGAVMESNHPELYKAITHIFRRSRKHVSTSADYSNHSIITADGVTLRLHESWFSTDFYLISRA